MTERISGMRTLSVISLGDGVAGGEGLAVHAGPAGRRTLFVAAEHAPADFVAVDVTDPRQPSVLYRNAIPAGVRSNNLAILGDLLAVTRQAKEPGGKPAGVEFFDISAPAQPRSIGFFDASGERSVGTHFVWLAADGFAYLATQAPDHAPRDPRDRFMMSVLDVSDPVKPSETGRWWPPGVGEADAAPPPVRPAERVAASRGTVLTAQQRAARRVDIGGESAWDFGFRVHNITVLPEQPDRAFVACTSGGGYILDISDRARPAVTGALQYAGPLPGAAHTFVPLGASGFAVLSDETLEDGAADFPQNVWVVDARVEDRPMIVGHVGPPWPTPVPAQGRFGAHNLHEYPPDRGALRDFSVVAGAFFGLGIAVYDFSSPLQPRELGRFAPGTRPGGPVTGQLNDVFIDDRAIVYTVDRRTDLCYVLEMDRS
jgi:hypothetical protein